MKHTNANFRAERSYLGLTQQNLADALKVDIRTIKRWEGNNTAYSAPSEVWDYLADVREKYEWTVEAALAKVENLTKEMDEPRTVELTYYRSQQELEKSGKSGFVGTQNAITREVAEILRQEGYEVEMHYPDETNSWEERNKRKFGDAYIPPEEREKSEYQKNREQ